MQTYDGQYKAKKISLLVGLKNALEYTKAFYSSTRAVYPFAEIIFVSYNSTDGTHEWLDSLSDDHLIYFYSSEEKTFSDTFNKCAELATGEYVVFAHNDMILAPMVLENLEKVLAQDRIVIYSTIEPPVFAGHERHGKIIRDFGIDVASVRIPEIYAFVEDYRSRLSVTSIASDEGSFFMCLHRDTLLGIAGLDPLFNPMFCEDDDLLMRLKLLGLHIRICLDAICYHFVSKTSRFSDEYRLRTEIIEKQSRRNFIRKWHFTIDARLKRTYDVGMIIANCNVDALTMLEPWAACVYTDFDADEYISDEQAKTAFDLRLKIQPLDRLKQHDVMVFVDWDNLNARSFRKISRLNELINKEINWRGNFLKMLLPGIKGVKIGVNKADSYEHKLIKRAVK